MGAVRPAGGALNPGVGAEGETQLGSGCILKVELIGLPDQLLDEGKENPVTPRFGPERLEG